MSDIFIDTIDYLSLPEVDKDGELTNWGFAKKNDICKDARILSRLYDYLSKQVCSKDHDYVLLIIETFWTCPAKNYLDTWNKIINKETKNENP